MNKTNKFVVWSLVIGQIIWLGFWAVMKLVTWFYKTLVDEFKA